MRWALSLFFALWAGAAYAQSNNICPEVNPPNDDERAKKAEDYFNLGEARYRIQEYEIALGCYKQSYLLSLQPTLLFNMGQCYRQLGKHEEALKSYRLFIRDAPDDKAVPGVKKIIVEEEEALKKEQDNKIKVEPKTGPVVDPPKTGPAVDPVVAGDPSLSPSAKKLYFGAAGGAAVGVVFGAISLSSARQAAEIQASTNPDVDQLISSFGRAKTTALVADALMIVSLGAGGAGFMLQQKYKKQQGEVSVSLTPTGASVSVRF